MSYFIVNTMDSGYDDKKIYCSIYRKMFRDQEHRERQQNIDLAVDIIMKRIADGLWKAWINPLCIARERLSSCR